MQHESEITYDGISEHGAHHTIRTLVLISAFHHPVPKHIQHAKMRMSLIDYLYSEQVYVRH